MVSIDDDGPNIQDIIRLNNEGVHNLVLQNSKGAINSFRQALIILGGGIPLSIDYESSNTSNLHLSAAPIPGVDDEGYYIHNQALLFGSSSFFEAQGFGTFAVLFNLGLAYHQIGARLSDQVKLQKALQLYRICANLVWGGEGPTLSSNNSDALALAALNNSAHILYRFLGDRDQASGLAHQLARPGVSVTPTPFMEQSHLDEILVNICIVDSGLPASPAA